MANNFFRHELPTGLPTDPSGTAQGGIGYETPRLHSPRRDPSGILPPHPNPANHPPTMQQEGRPTSRRTRQAPYRLDPSPRGYAQPKRKKQNRSTTCGRSTLTCTAHITSMKNLSSKQARWFARNRIQIGIDRTKEERPAPLQYGGEERPAPTPRQQQLNQPTIPTHITPSAPSSTQHTASLPEEEQTATDASATRPQESTHGCIDRASVLHRIASLAHHPPQTNATAGTSDTRVDAPPRRPWNTLWEIVENHTTSFAQHPIHGQILNCYHISKKTRTLTFSRYKNNEKLPFQTGHRPLPLDWSDDSGTE